MGCFVLLRRQRSARLLGHPLFEDDPRRFAVAVAFADAAVHRPAGARAAQRIVGGARAVALVGQVHRQPRARFQLPGETARRLGDRLFAAVFVQRQADDQRRRPPVSDQPVDRRPVRLAVLGDRGQRASGASQAIADGRADAALTVVEGQVLAQACPAAPVSWVTSTPSSRVAACQRSRGGSANSTSPSTGVFSQELCRISSSSWPALHPA